MSDTNHLDILGKIDSINFIKKQPGETKTSQFLKHYPIIYKLRHKGASWTEVAEFLKNECNLNFSSVHLAHLNRLLNNKKINAKFQDILVLSPLKNIPDYIINKSLLVEDLGIKLVIKSEVNLKYALSQDEIMQLKNFSARLLAKRFMYWYHISDYSLLTTELTPAYESIINRIDKIFITNYSNYYSTLMSETKYL